MNVLQMVLPFLFFITIFLFSIREKKKKIEFKESEFRRTFPSFLKGKFDTKTDLKTLIAKLESAGYTVKKVGEKLWFQNASSQEKFRSWLWSYGVIDKAFDSSFTYKVSVNLGAVLTVPAVLGVVTFSGLTIQSSIPPERTSIMPYFFLAFAFFFAISTFVSQLIKEKKRFREKLGI
ncbi:hypothetical protein CH373_02800 [Leptospira perolatii]|uniref:Uncharacterized protein n=1 Tax=Leptospira perolatii TaxID=2023191 RepID=A0A2M9ZSA8_9LEPT|nr:hypothetical protein [Leptospira perolatii]PJZ71443.1 hypothetical protein CH360_02800 [Leptospira perolatii]PJZ74977.1 hypothetical protein CH373_02800 [Leptospira perolatii]